MITPDGYIFDKEAILSYIVEQKKEQKRLTKAYENYLEMEENKKKMVDLLLFKLLLLSICRPKMLKRRRNDASSLHWKVELLKLFEMLLKLFSVIFAKPAILRLRCHSANKAIILEFKTTKFCIFLFALYNDALSFLKNLCTLSLKRLSLAMLQTVPALYNCFLEYMRLYFLKANNVSYRSLKELCKNNQRGF